MAKMYFGHPINTYNTPLESELIAKISETFPGWYVVNPNQEHHQKGYQSWKAKYGNGMDYYYKEVLPWCNAGIFLPFRDGNWGAGIFGEAEFLDQRGGLIYQISYDMKISRIGDLNRIKVLSIEKTRLRIRTTSDEVAPY